MYFGPKCVGAHLDVSAKDAGGYSALELQSDDHSRVGVMKWLVKYGLRAEAIEHQLFIQNTEHIHVS